MLKPESFATSVAIIAHLAARIWEQEQLSVVSQLQL